MGPCENEKPQALGWNIRGLGTHRASYRRWPKPRASCTDGSSLAKKARELYAGRHVWRFLAKNPAPAVPWGRNLGIGVILELSFPSSECRCKGVYEPGTADPEENPSKIAVRARFLANWRGRREACTSGDSILEAVRSSRGCNEGNDGVVRGWEAQSREARAAPVPLPGL